MQEQNKEKVKNILTRSFHSLPLANDLPRLAKHIRIFRDEQLLFPSDEHCEIAADYLYYIILHLSRLLVGDNQEELVKNSFDNYFKRKGKEDKISKDDENKLLEIEEIRK